MDTAFIYFCRRAVRRGLVVQITEAPREHWDRGEFKVQLVSRETGDVVGTWDAVRDFDDMAERWDRQCADQTFDKLYGEPRQ